MKIIDISLNNTELYAGCSITEVGGRATLTTPVSDAVNIVGRNAKAICDALTDAERAEGVTLTGAMAVWAYMVVFHQIVHRVKSVSYNDGRSGTVLIAMH